MSALENTANKAPTRPNERGGAVLNGIAFNSVNSTVIVGGKLWDRFFEISVPSFPRKVTVSPSTQAPSSSRTTSPTSSEALSGAAGPSYSGLLCSLLLSCVCAGGIH
mmetsp:Transcript_48564/g.95225  ORF Transcript_48564/g.95225 Transcript_48564/m.95225 type:complete len:107 (+) Transcript_48564:178-498(+)